MCTALTLKADCLYFGRNLDLEYNHHEEICITPRKYPFHFYNGKKLLHHYAMIGTAYISENYPLYYDATNEKGLSMAGLSFVGNAFYKSESNSKEEVATYEFIPYVLAQCASVSEVKELLRRIELVDHSFSSLLKVTPLHWIIVDEKECIVVESVLEGLKVVENPIGILTNNPSFKEMLTQLSTYMNLSKDTIQNNFSNEIDFKWLSNGMGALGLPGDCSSISRFVRCSFYKYNCVLTDNKEYNIMQFFHILDSVKVIEGSVKTKDGRNEKTVYTSCCDCKNMIYFYKTYEGNCICGVDLFAEDLEKRELISYEMKKVFKTKIQND